MNAVRVVAAAALLSTASAAPSSDADRAWQTILQQTAGPGNRFASQEEAINAARRHLDKQEAALRDFDRLYPADARHYSAQIRLATVIAAKARLLRQPPLWASAQKILSDLETNPATPLPVKADAGFARVSQAMEDAAGKLDDTARDFLLQTVRRFDADYREDRRTPNLLAELATLYDAQPSQKKSLLEEAYTRTSDESVRKRIGDDLKRISLLGRPLTLKLQPWEGGAPVELPDRHGHVVVLIFWASWSMPALHELSALKQVAAELGGQAVDFYGISLDEDRAALASTIKLADLKWPVHCDGRGWEGELVRSVGVNALPTVWVLDRKGVLLTLNARGHAAEVVRQALRD